MVTVTLNGAGSPLALRCSSSPRARGGCQALSRPVRIASPPSHHLTSVEVQTSFTSSRIPHTRPSRLSALPKPTSQWLSNRSLAYVLPLDFPAGRGLGTNDWLADAPPKGCARPFRRYGCVIFKRERRATDWSFFYKLPRHRAAPLPDFANLQLQDLVSLPATAGGTVRD